MENKKNSSKTEGIIFSTRRNQSRKDLKFNGNNIKWTNSVKYLGLFLDRNLSWGPHLKYMRNKAQLGTHKLHHLINHKSKLHIKLKILLYKSIIRPVLSYATPAWQSMSKSKKEKLQHTQNKVLRKIFFEPYGKRKKNKHLHNLANLEPIREFHTKLINNFNDKLDSLKNPIMNKIGKYDTNWLGRRHLNKLIPLKSPSLTSN